jgi:hypothetical protein
VTVKGVRIGNWLSIQQAQALLNAPDATTKKDSAIARSSQCYWAAVCGGPPD